MGVAIAILAVLYIVGMFGVSLCFWDYFHAGGEHSPSATVRNLVLGWGAPLAIGLAVWRSIVAQRQSDTAQKQAEIAQTGLLSNRYQRAVEMLGHDLVSIRIGGIHALRNIALEHPSEYWEEVMALLEVHLPEPKLRNDGKVVRVPPEKPEEKAAMQAIKAILGNEDRTE